MRSTEPPGAHPRRRLLAGALSALGLTTLGRAVDAVEPHDELRPELGPFALSNEPGMYDFALRGILLDEHRIRRCQMLAVPSFTPEWAVYITRNSAAAAVVAKRMSKSVYHDLLGELEKDDRAPVDPDGGMALFRSLEKHVIRRTTPLGAATADLLGTLWLRMLQRTTHPTDGLLGEDGCTYHFSHLDRELGFCTGKDLVA